VVHFDGLDFSGDVGGGESDDHTGLDDTGLDTTDGYGSDTADLVNVLKGQSEGLVGGSDGGFNAVNGFKESETLGSTGLGFLGPTLEPGHVARFLNHVLQKVSNVKDEIGAYITMPSRDGDEGNRLGVVSNLLDKVGGLLDDFFISRFRPFGSIHFVDGDNELLDTQGVGQEGVFTSLTILGDTSFELTNTSGNDD